MILLQQTFKLQGSEPLSLLALLLLHSLRLDHGLFLDRGHDLHPYPYRPALYRLCHGLLCLGHPGRDPDLFQRGPRAG